eukprot:g44101.t1
MIHLKQTCALPGREISDSFTLLRNTITYMQDRGVDIYLISLDQENAFDRISYFYIWDVLSKTGFGEGICNLIRLLYTNIAINGWEPENFLIKSG